MLKKISIVGVFGTFLFVSTLAPAQKTQKGQQAPTTSSDGSSLLGMVEGVVNFCGKVSLGSASGYTQIDQLFTQGQSKDALEQMRGNSGYKSSSNQVKTQLQALSPANALATCNAN